MSNSNTHTTPKNIVKNLTIIHLGFVFALFAFGMVQFFTNDIASTSQVDQADNMVYVFPILGLAGFFMGNFIFKQLLAKAKHEPTLIQKLTGYQTASLIRWALLEGPALLNLVWFGLTGDSLYLMVGASLFICLLWLRPSKAKIAQELELKGESLN